MPEEITLSFINDGSDAPVSLTVFDDANMRADGWTINMSKGQAAIIAAKLLQFAATDDY
ncbi:MAG: hypothetical protein [Bacteriophage sp.]|nr:MAG: hypothetical protein [Bacteriophage sp.]